MEELFPRGSWSPLDWPTPQRNPYGRNATGRPLGQKSAHARQQKRAKAKQIRRQKQHMRRMAR